MKGLKSLTKKIMALILTTMMIASMMPVQAFAETIIIDPTTPPEERVIGDTNDTVSVSTTSFSGDEGDMDVTIGKIDVNIDGLFGGNGLIVWSYGSGDTIHKATVTTGSINNGLGGGVTIIANDGIADITIKGDVNGGSNENSFGIVAGTSLEESDVSLQ